MPERNCIRTKLIFAVAIVVLVVGLMPLPAFAVLADESAVSVIGNVEWDDGGNREHKRPESIKVRLFANGTESQSLTFGVGESGQWLFTFDAVPIRDSEGKKIVYTVSVDEIAAYTTDVAKVGDYAFSITNTLKVDPGEKTVTKVTETPKAGTLTYNGIWQALVSAGSTEDGQMMYALGADSVTVPSKESFGVRPSIGKNAGEYYVWYYVKGDAFHYDSDPVCVSATIGKLPATITVKDQVYEYNGQQQGEGDTAYDDPTEIAEKVTVEGLLKSDTLTSVVLDGEKKEAGVYEGEIKVTGYTIGEATGNYAVTTVPGTLTITRESCEVAFVNFDGTVLQRGQVAYGKMPEYTGATPERAATAQCTYTFAGWTPAIAAATNDATYTATYTETAKKGTLTFDLGGGTIDGKTSLTIEAEVGDVITIPKAPVRDGYTFKYWKGSKYYPGDKYTVQGDHAFTAVWEKKSDNGGSSGGTSDNRSVSSNTPGKSSTPKTGDEHGGTVAVFGAMAMFAFCLAFFARCKS